ncbi:type VI secretion system Vgr family protein [Chitinophaga solisilvae]|uniref:type VI secretion system Vgr family protein n=1 Tax=Chitinophaga solisilvae TaxID=1233460 RepID=UPI00136CE1BB|nr:phage baseplate assembly protein V [Chitinophaga solisilvae]
MPLNTITLIYIDRKEFRHYRQLLIRQDMHGHHTFELQIHSGWLRQQEGSLFSSTRSLLGKPLNVHIAAREPLPQLKPLSFTGIITAVHAGKEGDSSGGFCTLKGESPDILLDGDPHMQVYEEQSLSAIVTGCSKDVTPYINTRVTPANQSVHPYLVQYRESNYAFLRRLAARFGEWFFYDGQRLIFGNYTPRKITLTHPSDLADFDLSLRIKSNNSNIGVYDYLHHHWIAADTANALQRSCNEHNHHALQVSNRLFPSKSAGKLQIYQGNDLREQLSAQQQRYTACHLSTLVQLNGSSRNPGIRIGDTIRAREMPLVRIAGSVIKEEKVPSPELEGDFTITQITHHCNGDGAYNNTFSAIPTDCCKPSPAPFAAPRCEAQSAVVTDNHDPAGLGRIRIKFRWQQQGNSPWVRIVSPHSGDGKGFYFLPEKGEEVWADFEGGNPELPFILGSMYNGKDHTQFGDAGNNLKVIKTRSGHTIRLDDTSGAEQLHIRDKSGNSVILDTARGNITITSPGRLLLNAREISLQATDNIDIHAGENITQGAGESHSTYAGTHATTLAAHITQQAWENFTRTSARLEEQADHIRISSLKENITLSSSKTVVIKGAEKVKLS